MHPSRSLRHRVLVLFALLAVGPLLALGVLDYVYAPRSVEDIMASQTAAGVARAKALILERHDLLQTDALLLAENAETQRLFSLLATGDTTGISTALARGEAFMETVWTSTKDFYRTIELRDQVGAVRVRRGDEDPESSAPSRGPGRPGSVVPGSPRSEPDAIRTGLAFPIVEGETDRRIGTVFVDPMPGTLLPDQLGTLASGRAGYLLIIDRSSQRTLFDSRWTAPVVSAILGIDVAALVARLEGQDGVVRYVERDSARFAWAEHIPQPPWTVLSVAAVPEFTVGLRDRRLLNLALIIAIAAATAMAFTILIGRTTRSLEALATAAGAVEAGDLAPRLPPPSDDEAGMLSSAFERMLGRIRTTMREIEVSRQLAVLGEFSAQLAHEIRNPLTSIKLNLQELTREARRGRLPDAAGPPLETCLREVNRLDGVVRRVLALARPRSTTLAPCSTHTLLDRVLGVHAAELTTQSITVVREYKATRDTLVGDEEALVGLFSNLVVNAIEAQPRGGRLLVVTQESSSDIEIVVADDGPGIAPGLADQLFRPFVTTKISGTGLGLAMALRVTSDHDGRLELTTVPVGFTGSAFRVTLPLA